MSKDDASRRGNSRRKRPGDSVVAEPPPPPYVHDMATARVFQSGNSQAVRLPKEFRLKATEVQIFRRGGDIVIRERPVALRERLLSLPPLPDDAFPDTIPDALPEPVEKL
jgi:antitoxin VapB